MSLKLILIKKGFLEIASVVNKLNKPLSTTILQDLFNLGKLKLSNISLELPVLNKNPNLNPWWISGFICGEGSFTYFTRTRKNSKGKISKDYTLVMEVSQDNKDSFILTCIQEYFNVGKIYYEIRGIAKFRLVIKKDIIEKMVPHFSKYSLLGFKNLQYLIWIKIVNILVLESERNLERDKKLDILIKELSSLI